MKFNSQICTSRSQSERLLALGLKKETADCVIMYYDGWHIGEAEHFDFDKDPVDPAWSLHRLWELAGFKRIELDSKDEICVIYDGAIDTIEGLIKKGYFNKEYLE